MKKILSLILALSLIISVAPMSFATGAGETDDEPGMHFRFNAAAFDKTADISNADIETIDDTNTFASIGTDPWYMDGKYGVADSRITSAEPDTGAYPNAKPKALYWKHTNYGYLHEATASGSYTGNAGSALVLRVELNETGVFTPSITYEAGPTASNYHFLLAPVSTYTSDYGHSGRPGKTVTHNGALAGYYNEPNPALIMLGEQNLYAPESTTKNDVPFDPVTIEAGEYYLFLVPYGRINELPAKGLTSYEVNLYSIDFTPMPKETADAAFTAKVDTENPPVNVASIAAYTVCGNGTPEILETADVTYGETCELEAPLTKEVGDKTYNFLYWARGLDASSLNKKIVSCDSKFTYRPYEGINYLIAVYEDAAASTDKVEFYNGNGELMTDVELDAEGNLPAAPYMAGHGESTGWKLHQEDGNGKVYEAGEAAPESGTRIFVAQYDDPTEDIVISINGTSDTYAYGDVVTCESTDEKFSYWEKTVNGKKQIVSLDKTYTFNAWEDCTVEAVCNGAFDLGRAARKILFGTFTVGNQTAVMAEFIGFDGAKEKGIVIGAKEIAMQSGKNQFTITNDTDAEVTVSGYAIVDNGRYVDGEVTVAAKK